MVTDTLRAEAWQSESQLPLVLIEIDHADLTTPIRVVCNKANITSNGDEFIAFPFEIFLPDSKDDAPPRARLRIDNVSREIGQAIRTIATPPDVTILVVRPDDPDVVEAEFSGMKLNRVTYDALSVEGELEFEDLTREPFPPMMFSPSIFRSIL